MKKEIECSLVQDLSLNYLDGVLSENSKKFVENHLENCKDCSDKLNLMKKNVYDDNINDETKEIDYLKNVKKKISKKNKSLIIIGTMLILIIIFNVIVFINYKLSAVQMNIFLKDEISQEQLQDIKKKIKQFDESAEIIYNSKLDSLKTFEENFKDENTDIFKPYYEEGKNIFPANYLVKSKNKNLKNIVEEISSMEGVENVISTAYLNPYESFLVKILSILKQ